MLLVKIRVTGIESSIHMEQTKHHRKKGTENLKALNIRRQRTVIFENWKTAEVRGIMTDNQLPDEKLRNSTHGREVERRPGVCLS